MKVRIPTPLYSYTRSRSVVDAEGATVDALMRDLDRQFPGLRFRVIDEQDQVRPHMKIFVNGVQVLDLKTAIEESDRVVLMQALSGG